MKTKELIRQLNEADPTGEVEVCVGNVDIHFVSCEPAYYDGPLQVLIRDETRQGYNIIGAKYKRSGEKVQIHELSIVDAMTNFGEDVNFTVDYSEITHDAINTMKAHAELRQFMRDLDQRIEMEYFVKWVKAEAAKLTADGEDVKNIAESFFKKNLDYKDAIVIGKGQNYVEAREFQWATKVSVVIDEGFLKIAKKE